LFIVFLLSLYWMIANGAGGEASRKWRMGSVQALGTGALVVVLAVQTVNLAKPVLAQLTGVPYSRSADVAALLRRPELSGAIVMADPDTMVEPLAYYVSNPFWLLRQQRFGRVVPLTSNGRSELSLDEIITDAERLHRQSGRPVVFLSHLELQDVRAERRVSMYSNTTLLTPESVRRLRSSARLLARLRPAMSDEEYEVYLFPR
jgi:hypothetical protein